MRQVFCALMAALLLGLPHVRALPLSADSACLLDCGSGRVLYAADADRPGLIASTTKIMTALVICEQCSPDARVRVPREAVGIEGSSLYLREGEVLTVRELLYGMMLQSGNDAAMALAIYCAGDAGAFADRMNQRAVQLGLRQTHGANPHGLDDEQNRSTASDLARLAAAAMDNPLFRQVVSTRSCAVGQRRLTNHNKLLWRYPGAVGVKTGYTRAAGRILVSAAERDGRRLVAVTMNAPDDWNDHQKLLDYGFTAFPEQTLLRAGETVTELPLAGGRTDRVPLIAARTLRCALAQEENWSLRLETPPFLYAPIAAGDQVGRAVLVLEGAELASVELVCGQTAPMAERPGWFRRLLGVT